MIQLYVMYLPQRATRWLGRRLCACAMAIAAGACSVLSIDGCGIMVSSDCAQKAVCRDEAGAAEATPPPPDNIDGNAGAPEGGSDVGSERDVGSELVSMNAEAGARDAVSEDVSTELPPPPPPDGSCNSPYTCAAPVPAGWTGPALFWTASSSETAPTCPEGYQSKDLNQALTGTDMGSCDCTCSLSGETCQMTATFHPDQACGTSTCALSDGGRDTIKVNPPPDGTCTPIPDNRCGSASGSVMTDNATAYSATCAPTVTATRPTASWANSGRLCSTACSNSGQPCVIGPTTSFVATACVFQSGDVACPMTAYVNKSLLYTGFNDSRSCGPCTCNAVDGGTCFNLGLGTASQITVYGTSNCGTGSGSWADITLDVCSLYNSSNSTLTANPASMTYMPTITHGDCSGGVASAPRPDGGVAPTGPTTICCM